MSRTAESLKTARRTVSLLVRGKLGKCGRVARYIFFTPGMKFHYNNRWKSYVRNKPFHFPFPSPHLKRSIKRKREWERRAKKNVKLSFRDLLTRSIFWRALPRHLARTVRLLFRRLHTTTIGGNFLKCCGFTLAFPWGRNFETNFVRFQIPFIRTEKLFLTDFSIKFVGKKIRVFFFWNKVEASRVIKCIVLSSRSFRFRWNRRRVEKWFFRMNY